MNAWIAGIYRNRDSDAREYRAEMMSIGTADRESD